MGIINKLFNKRKSQPDRSSWDENLSKKDHALDALIENPDESELEIIEEDNYLYELGIIIFREFLISINQEDILNEMRIGLKDSYRIRLELGKMTLWLYDFEESDDFGISGESNFKEYIKLPRIFMPEKSTKVIQAIREYIVDRVVLRLKIKKKEDSKLQIYTIGYYFGLLEFPDDKEQSYRAYFPNNVQDKLIQDIWNKQHKDKEEPQEQSQFDNPEGVNYSVIQIENLDVEKVAYDLIKDSLPKTFINEIDISTDEGLSKFLACLMIRRHQAAIEKDEIIEFVNKNKTALDKGRLAAIKHLFEAAMKTPTVENEKDVELMFKYFQDIIDYIELAYHGKADELNIKSDRLLWLLYAMALQLSSEKLEYFRALEILTQPQNTQRISPLSLMFMLYDYADTIGKSNQGPVEYILLIAESALLTNDADSLSGAMAILPKLDLPGKVEPLKTLLTHSISFLASKAKPTEEAEAYLHKIQSRFDDKIPDNDL